MNEQIDIVNLLKDKTALVRYIYNTILSSDKFAQNLPQLREKGWSEQGMLDKVIEITAIQSQQIKHLALVALLVVQSRDFDGHVADIGEQIILWDKGEHHHYEVTRRIYGANAEEKVGVWNLYVKPKRKGFID